MNLSPCQVCQQTSAMRPVFFMGRMPPPSTREDTTTLLGRRYYYPVHMVVCEACQLVQLEHSFPMDEIFDPHAYTYTTGTTKVLVEHFKALADEVSSKYAWEAGDQVLDIGSNDGTLLAFFQRQGFKVLGIDPAPAAEIANQAGIPTKKAFFTLVLAQEVRKNYGLFRFVTSTNNFAHIPNPVDICRGIECLLAKDGVLVIEVQYLQDTLDKTQFDTLYLEHLRFYSVTSLGNLLAQSGLEMFDVQRIPTHGGSIRVIAGHKGNHPVQPAVVALLAQEQEVGWLEKLNTFGKDALIVKHQVLKQLFDIHQKGQRTYGLSATARGSMMSHYLGLDEQLIDCVLEIKGSLKIGQFMPGTRIPIVDEERLKTDPPDYLFVFAWHIAQDLINVCKRMGYEGKLILPLPQPVIL